MSANPMLEVKRLVVPTIINDVRENVLRYIETQDNNNILKNLIEKIEDNPVARCNLNFARDKDDEEHMVFLEFGFVYPYDVKYSDDNDKIEKRRYVLAGIINCETKVSSIDDVIDISKRTLLEPVLSKATQLSHNLTAEVTNVPIGFDFSKDVFSDEE